jgi:hypothetical protein
LNSKNGLYHSGDEIIIEFVSKSKSDPQCFVWGLDSEGKKTLLEKINSSSSNKKYRSSISMSETGMYYVSLGPKVEDLSSEHVLATFVILPANKRIGIESAFGGHLDAIDLKWHMKTASDLIMSWVRAHDGIQTGWWTRVQPTLNEWIWPYDKVHRQLNKKSIAVLGGLLWSPPWISKDGKNKKNVPPTNYQEYQTYVKKVVSRYQKEIRYWEVWNEPYATSYWKSSPEKYVELLTQARQAIKSVDPDIKVVGGVLSPLFTEWNSKVIEAGLLDEIDILSIHYHQLDYQDKALELILAVREKGFKGEIWNSETRVYSAASAGNTPVDIDTKSKLHDVNAAYYLVRLYLENFAMGISKIFNYTQINPDRGKDKAEIFSKVPDTSSTSMWGSGNNPKAMVSSYAGLKYLLDGMGFVQQFDVKKKGMLLFSSTNRAVVAQATNANNTRTVCAPITPLLIKKCDLHGYDYQGREFQAGALETTSLVIGPQPWYLECRGQKSEDMAKQIISEMSCE